MHVPSATDNQRGVRVRSAAARTLGNVLAQVEERSVAQLQRIDAKCDARAMQLANLHRRVAAATDASRERRLDEWTQSLAMPLG